MAPAALAPAMSSALAARIGCLRARIASAIAASASSFCAAERERQPAGGRLGAAADVVHQAGGVGRALDGLERSGHGAGPSVEGLS